MESFEISFTLIRIIPKHNQKSICNEFWNLEKHVCLQHVCQASRSWEKVISFGEMKSRAPQSTDGLWALALQNIVSILLYPHQTIRLAEQVVLLNLAYQETDAESWECLLWGSRGPYPASSVGWGLSTKLQFLFKKWLLDHFVQLLYCLQF